MNAGWDTFALLLIFALLVIFVISNYVLALLLNTMLKKHSKQRFRHLFTGGLSGIVPALIYFNLYIDSFPNKLLSIKGLILLTVWFLSSIAGALAFSKYKATSS
jgi:hypothetical protein